MTDNSNPPVRPLVERLRSRAWEDRYHRKYREEAAREIEHLTAALVKVVAHTGHTKTGPDQLHIDLLARIEHIAQSALQGRDK